MAVQRLRKSGSLYRCIPVGVLCALSMIAFNSAPAAQEPAISGNGSGQQSDTVRPRLVHDGSLTLPHYPYDLLLYRGIRDGQTDSHEINKDTPYFHEPLIKFRKDTDGRPKHAKDDRGHLTLYVSLNSLEPLTVEAVKTHLQEKRGVSKSDLPFDANIQPLSVRGWFESSADENIRSDIWKVTMSSRRGDDIAVHFPMSTPDAADSFLSRLHANETQLLFNYSLRGDAIEVCTVDASANTMTNHRRFQELTGDASRDGHYVSRDQIADLMSEISRHESISSNCRTEAVAKELRDKALERLADKAEIGFTIDHLDTLTNNVQDDIRVDIDNASNRIQAREEREEIQRLSQQVRSGAMSFGLFIKAIIKAIPFAAEATVDMSKGSGEAYQFMWDSLSRVHDQLEWTGTRHRPKSIDVYRKEQLRNALNTSIQFRHETPVYAEDIRDIPMRPNNWIADDEEQASTKTLQEVLSARLATAEASLIAAQEMIEALRARVEAPRLGNALPSRTRSTGVWVKGADLRIDAEADRELRDERGRALGGDIRINAEAVKELRNDDDGIPRTVVYGGDVKIDAESDMRLDAEDDLDLIASGYRSKEESKDWLGGDINLRARKDIGIDAGREIVVESEGGRIYMHKNRRGVRKVEIRSGRTEIDGHAIELNVDRITVNGQSLMDYIREHF